MELNKTDLVFKNIGREYLEKELQIEIELEDYQNLKAQYFINVYFYEVNITNITLFNNITFEEKKEKKFERKYKPLEKTHLVRDDIEFFVK